MAVLFGEIIMCNPCEKVCQSLPNCVQNVTKSRWVEVALFVSAAVLITLGLLISFGILPLSGNALTVMWAGGSFFAGLAISKLLLQSYKKKDKPYLQTTIAPPEANRMEIQLPAPADQQLSPPLFTTTHPAQTQQQPLAPLGLEPAQQRKIQLPVGGPPLSTDFLHDAKASGSTVESDPLTNQETLAVVEYLFYRISFFTERGDHGRQVMRTFVRMCLESGAFRSNPHDFLVKVDLSPLWRIADKKFIEVRRDEIENTINILFRGIWNMRQNPPRAFY